MKLARGISLSALKHSNEIIHSGGCFISSFKTFFC
jgi:hypothetical protein